VSDHDEREDYDDDLRSPVRCPQQLRRIATGLWLFAAVQLVFIVVLFILLAYAVVASWADKGVRASALWDINWWFAGLFLAGAWNALIVWGAGRMDRCHGYRCCVAVAGLSVLPIPCCLLALFTIPLGICALAELSSPEVRLAFERAARRRTVTLSPSTDRSPHA